MMRFTRGDVRDHITFGAISRLAEVASRLNVQAYLPSRATHFLDSPECPKPSPHNPPCKGAMKSEIIRELLI
jgi:hypothetical protein